MKNRITSFLIVLCTFVLSNIAQSQSYNIIDLGGLLGTNSYAFGINNQGQVVGYWNDTNGARAYLYSGGLVTDLGSLGGTNQYALSINSSGQIVGFAAATNGVRAFLYSNGALTNLGTMGGLNSYAYGINDAGQIVGYLDTTNGARAYLYGGNGVTNLGTLGGTNSFAFGVNNSNLVVGSSLTVAAATHAFLWQNGGLTNLNSLLVTNSGWVLNDARGINNGGKIVGWGLTNGQEQAFLYAGGQITRVGMLSGATNSFAFGINNSNQVVGASTLSNSTSRAFVWLNGTLTDLNTLLPAGFNWDLREARGINDNGQIVGWGVTNGQEHAFILSPNHVPSVSLTNPVDNAVFAASISITLQASASDSDGSIAKVEFYQGTTKLGEATTSPYQMTWSSVSGGSYTLTAKAIDNSGATNISAAISITVAIAPTISTQPQSQSVLTSSNVTFSVTAAGATPLSYQWRFNGVNIAGATGTNYSIVNVQTVHAGSYSVVVTNIAGSLTSASAVLAVKMDPRNIGKGDWIYLLSDATNRLGQNVNTVTDIPSLMNYERLQGMQFIVVKCGDGETIWNQYDAALVAQAHAAGLKIFGYGRVYGTNISGEISVATNALALGADGFVIDAEIEYESQNLANNSAAAVQYCQGIRSAYPNAFLAHSPFVYISSHTTFPYIAFGTNCDVVMPQCYWKSFGITASNMVSVLNTEWKNWQNSLTGANTNAIKPIAPIGQGWSVSLSNTTTGTDLADFVNRLKTTATPATSGGYKGVSFWRADLHTPDMWDRIASSTIGNATGAPLITTQPDAQVITNGLTANFWVQATGVAPLTYQWRLNGVSISGATATDYTITNVQSANVGVYSVIVSNASGVVLSTDAMLSIPSYVFWTETFETGLTNWTTVSGASALTNSSAQNHTASGTNSAKMGSTLNKMSRNTGAEVSGNAKATFWIYDSGSSALRALGEVRAYSGSGYGGGSLQQILGIGAYRVSFGTGTGNLATETYDSNKYQGRVNNGTNAGFFNLNATNSPNRSVGWHKCEIEKLSNETTVNFYVDGVLGRTITNATAATWDSVSIGSVAAGSTAGDAWFDDIKIEYFGAPIIVTQPLDRIVNVGTSVTFTVSASGNAISGYQWRFNGVNIAGATTTSLALSNVQSANAGDYTVVVKNGVGATVSATATLTVLYPPSIVTQPANQTGNAGGSATFRVVTGGPGPFTYQWKKNGIILTNSSNVLNATTDQLTLTNLTQVNEGDYSVTVSNAAGSVNSASALLTVDTEVIFYDTFEGGLTNWSTVPGASFLALSTTHANPVSGSQTAGETNSLNKMYHNLGTEVSGRSRATFWIYNATPDTTTTRSFGEVRAFSGSGLNSGSLQQVLAIGNYTVSFDQNTGSLTNESVIRSVYQGRVYAGTNSGWFNLDSIGAPSWSPGWHKFSIEKSSNGTAVHFFVDGIFGRTIDDVNIANWDVVEIGSAGIGAGVDEAAWFDDVKVEALTNVITSHPASVTRVVGTTATLSVTATGSSLTYQWRKDGANIAGATLSSCSITNVQTYHEGDYSVLVTTSADREYSALARLTVVTTPVITVQPDSQSVGAGSNVLFSVSASGGALSYQWKKNGTNLTDGGRISGAMSADLTLLGVSQSDATNYTVFVSNLGGSVTSSSAILTVIDPPAITVQPQPQSAAVGGSVTLTMTATGTAPVTYQWKKNGVNISGATNASLALTSLTVANSGSYLVVVANAAGTATSSLAVLTIISAPTICTQPTNVTVNVGQNVQFAVGVCTSSLPTLPSVSSGTLMLWLKADQGIITNSTGLVSTWQDQSGNGNDAIQATATNKPAWIGTAVFTSGKPALRFNGIQDPVLGSYLHGTNNVGITNSYTSFIVYSRTDQNSYSEKVPVMLGAAGSGNNVRAYYISGDQMAFAAWSNDYFTGFAITNNTYRIWSQRMNTNKTVMESYDADGVNSWHFTNDLVSIGAPASGYYVGGLASQTRNFMGDIAEVIYYRGSLTDSDRLAVENYLTQKYFTADVSNTYVYQWQKDGTNLIDQGSISGATTMTLHLSNIGQVNEGNYRAFVTNAAGGVTSSVASLTVIVPPSIVVQPNSQVICAGESCALSVAAMGTSLQYQWRLNGVNLTEGGNLSGSRTSTLHIETISALNAGHYSVCVTNCGGTLVSSAATVTVTSPVLVDLDIDSWNTNGFNPPARSQTEELIESDVTQPGKYISANDGDVDQDGIPDFADGFDYMGNEGINRSAQFVPIILHLAPSDVLATKIKFTYSASNPALLTNVPDAHDGYVYIPAPGDMRIWKKDGIASRKKNPVHENGDYVAPEVFYSLSELGFSRLNPVVTLYVEGIRPSPTGGETILVEADKDGYGQGCLQSDVVRVSIDIDSDRDGLVDRWESQLGTDINLVDTDGDSRSDFEELWDGTDPGSNRSVMRQRLLHLTFADRSLNSEEGAVAFYQSGCKFSVDTNGIAHSWDEPSLNLVPAQGDTQTGLGYPLFRSPKRPNLTPKRGSVSFWFQPNWESGGAMFDASPQDRFTLFSLEQLGTNDFHALKIPFWGLELDHAGTNLSFSTARASGNTNTIHLISGRVQWLRQSNELNNAWHNIALAYSETNLAIFADGELLDSVASTELGGWPGTLTSTNAWRFWVGGRQGENLANGSFEDVQTFNYVLSTNEIHNIFRTVADRDTDRDGLTDLDELARGLSPRDPDSDGDGMPDGWEVLHGLNPRSSDDAKNDPDGDQRKNLNEFLFGTDPHLSNIYSSAIDFDLVGVSSNKAGLINIDFGQSSKPVLQRGPVAAGIDTNDQWVLWPSTGYKNPLKDASGANSGLSMSSVSSPIYILYHGYTNLDDPVSGELCEPFESFGCGCLNSCELSIEWFSPVIVENSVNRILPKNGTASFQSGNWGQNVGPYNHPGYPQYPHPHYPSINVPTPPRLPKRLPPPCGDLVACVQIDPCTTMYRLNHMVRDASDTHYDPDPDSDAGYINLPEYYKENWMFDIPSYEGAAPPMLSDYSTSTLDGKVASSFGSTNSFDTNKWWKVNIGDVRARIILTANRKKAYRVYLYGGPDQTSDRQLISFANGRKTEMVRIPGGSCRGGYVEGVNYVRFLIQPKSGYIDLNWIYKNSSLRGMQVVELQPMQKPNARAHSLLITGPMIEWDPVPQALRYNILRQAAGETNYTQIAITTGTSFQDYSVLPFNEDPNSYPRSYNYIVQAENEVYARKSDSVSATVQWTLMPGTSIGASPHVEIANNQAPVLNFINPLTQAYERTPFTFGAAKIQAAASALDLEGSPLQFVITRIDCGTLTWIQKSNEVENVEQLTNEQIESELNSGARLRIVGPDVTLRWTPPDGALDNVVAMKVRAFDGVTVSRNAVDLPINVKPQTLLLWWGNHSYGMSGGGIAAQVPLQLGLSPWRGYLFGNVPDELVAYEKFGYSKMPAPVLVNPVSAAQFPTNEYSPVVDGSLRNVISMAGASRTCGPLGNRLALTSDGNVWNWGIGRYGQLVDGNVTSPDPSNVNMLPWFSSREQPFVTRVAGMSNAVSIAGNGDYSLVAQSDGSVWGWGASIKGYPYHNWTQFTLCSGFCELFNAPFYSPPFDKNQLSFYSAVTYSAQDWNSQVVGHLDPYSSIFAAVDKPVKIPGLENIVQVVSSATFCGALSADSKVYMWGYWRPEDGETGEIKLLTGINERVVQIVAGEWFLVALTESGKIYQWNHTHAKPVAELVAGVEDVKQIAACHYNFLALLKDGRVVQWGAMGAGANQKTFILWPYLPFPSPDYVPGLKNIVSVSAGWESAFAVDSDGYMWAWGIDNGTFGLDYEFSRAPNSNWMPRNWLYKPMRIGMVREAEMGKTFDMNGYASAIIRDVPQNLSAKPADHSVTLSWDTFVGAQQYVAKRAVAPEGPFTPIGTAVNVPALGRQTYIDSDAVNFQEYFYRVAITVNGHERLSDPITVTPQPPPSIPTGLKALGKSRQVRVAWPAKNVVDSYRVWRSRTSDSTGFSALVTMMNQAKSENRQMFIDDAYLVPGTTNWYRLQAINPSGESDLSETVSAITTDLGPIPPSSVSVVPFDTSVSLAWAPAADTNGHASYIVYKAKASCDTNQTLNPSNQVLKWEFVAHVAGTSNDITKLIQGQCYAFAVSTVDDRGEGVMSVPSTTRPGADLGFPEIKVLEHVAGPGSIYLKWECPVDLFLVSARSGPTNGTVYPLCGQTATDVFPDEDGVAELWLTGLEQGLYSFTIARITDSLADSQGITVSVQVTNDAPNRAYAYPMRPLLATSASNRVELSWWGSTENDAKSALDQFRDWRFIVLRQEVGNVSEGFPCDNFVPVGDGAGVTFSDTNVVNGHTYQYRLVGLDPDLAVYERNLGDSPGITNTSITPAAAFGVAAGLTLNALPLNGAVQLTWNCTNWALSDMAQVKVELLCARGPGDRYDLLTNVTSDHVYLHDHLDNGVAYYYKVRALHQNGDFLEKDLVATPSADQPMVAPQQFTAGIGVGKLTVQWRDVAAASAYKVQKWNTATSQYAPFTSVALPGFVDALGGSNAVYRYRVSGISGGQEGLATDIRVQPLTWTWSTNSLSSPTPVVTRFDIQRQCPGATQWTTIGTSMYMQYVDVRTECVDSAALYRIVPIADGVPDESLAVTPVQIKTGDPFLTLPPESINTFVDGTNVNEHGEIVIRLLDFESATNADSAVGFSTPTNVMLHASISFAPNDSNVHLDHVEFYADGELLANVPQLPYDYTWRNPAGTISGRLYQLRLRVVDSLGRSKDSQIFYANVTNLPPLKAFMTSVNDLQVTAPGVPLSVSRSYNSQDSRVGLLGKGWKTPWDQAHVSVPNLADGWVSKRTIISAQPFDIQETNSHRVEVVLPGGGVEHFRLAPTYPTDSTARQSGVAGINIGVLNADVEDDFVYRLPFVFAPEGDAMGNLAESHGATVLQVGGQDFILDGYANTEVEVNLSRGDKVAFAPDSFRYTASDGSLYDFSQPLATCETNVNESCLISVSDRNGNKVSYSSSIIGSNRVFTGMSHSNGRSLLWTNETISGTAYICVYDPIAQASPGAKPVLRYKVENDLLQEVQHLRSRDGSSEYDVTRYEYFQGLTGAAAALNGMLKRVISSEGAILLENDYFGTAVDDPPEYLGFLKSQKDVVGVSASLDHEPDDVTGDLTSTVTQTIPGADDATQSEAVYDSSGKPVTVVDESGQTSSMGYDEKGRLAFTQNEAGDYKGFDYDAKNRPIAVTDELGNQTQVRYGALDQPTDTIDAAGAGTHYEYYHYTYGHTTNDPNPEGSLRSVRDAAGVATEYTYDNRGQVLTESRIVPGSASAFQTTYEYYSTGDLKAVKEPLWAGGTNKLYTTEYAYDENGNRKTEKRYRNVLSRNNLGETNDIDLETVCTTYNYDAQGRLLTSTTSIETSSGTNTLQTTSSHYNLAGKVDYTVDAYGRKTVMLYDVRGNLIETTYVDNAVTRTVYDGRGRAIWQQERCTPSGGLTTAPATFTEYDAGGRVKAVKRYGSVTLQKSTATPKSELQSVTDSQTQYRRSTAITSPQDQYTITVSGSVAADAFLSISRTVYDNLGRVHYSMDTRGVVTGYDYDAVGRRTNVAVYTSYTVPGLTNAMSPTGSHTDTAYGYDENGNQVWVTDALGNRTDFEYDTMNRRTITRFPAMEGESSLRRYRKTIYDALGRRIGEVDEAGIVTAFRYDVLGRLTAVTNDFKLNYPSTEEPIVTTYGYDAFGNEISQRDAQGRITYFEYDALGRRTHRFLPGAGWEDTSTNVFLERTIYSQVQVQSSPAVYAMRKQVKDFRGRTNTFDFDILDRLVKTTPSDVDGEGNAIAAAERTTVDYAYNGNGQRAQVVQSGGTARTVRYAYDTLGRLRVKDTPEGTLTYQYESSGALSKISARYGYTGWGTNAPYRFESLTAGTADTTRAEWNYCYDSLGRLQKVNPDSTNALANADATYSYTDVGNLNTTTYRNGLVTTYSYNKRNWLRNLETKNGAGTRVAFFDYDANSWAAQNRLSPTGQRRCVQETYGSAARTVTYAFDRLSRLLTENIVPASTGPTGAVSYDRSSPSETSQGYDLVGNRLSRRLIDDHGLATAGLTETNQTYDAHDLISTTEFAYDASGNTTRDAAGAAYSYDAENRLIKRTGGTNGVTMPTVSIVYDADGNRVGKTISDSINLVTTAYLVEDRNPTGYAQVMEEWASTNSATLALNRTYVYGLDLISQKQGAKIAYYGYDGLGSTRYLSDSSANTIDTYTYDAFGIQIASTGSTPNMYRYTGEQLDPDLGMYYLRARYYKPELGRFWTMDSFEGNQSDPSSIHKYTYVSNEPVLGTDPTGFWREICSDFILGKAAEAPVIANFLVKRPNAATIVGRTIHGILGYASRTGFNGIGRLLPDLVDHSMFEIYDVKSWNETLEGMMKVQSYVVAFNEADRDPVRSTKWHAGLTYDYTGPNPVLLPVMSGAKQIYAVYFPTEGGVIPYRVYEVENEADRRRIPIPLPVRIPVRERRWDFDLMPPIRPVYAAYRLQIGAPNIGQTAVAGLALMIGIAVLTSVLGGAR